MLYTALFSVINIWINNLIHTPCLFLFCLFQESLTDVPIERPNYASSLILTTYYDVIIYIKIKIKMYYKLLYCCYGKNKKSVCHSLHYHHNDNNIIIWAQRRRQLQFSHGEENTIEIIKNQTI